MAVSFRGLRLDVAVALSDPDRRRTLYETARALGRRSGDIQRVVRQMTEEGILEPSDAPPTRGTLYRLDPRYREALEEALKTDQPEGQVVEHQRVIRVKASDRTALLRTLGRVDLTATVSWAAECDRGWLLALAPAAEDADSLRLEAELRDAGFKCDAYRVGRTRSGDALRRLAIQVGEKPTVKH